MKKILTKRVNVISQCIKLIVYGEIDLTDKDNRKLLSEKFSNGIKINIAKSNISEEILKEPLIENGQLREKSKNFFSEIFEDIL